MPRAFRRGSIVTEIYTGRIWDPKAALWESIERDVLRLEHEAFGDKAFDGAYLRAEFTDPSHVVAVLSRPSESNIRGFTYAVPVIEIDRHRAPRAVDTAYIADTILEPWLRGRALVGIMMSCLETELRRRGFAYVERHAAVAHDYASKIRRAYVNRIEVERRPNPSEWGPQVFFRIRL